MVKYPENCLQTFSFRLGRSCVQLRFPYRACPAVPLRHNSFPSLPGRCKMGRQKILADISYSVTALVLNAFQHIPDMIIRQSCKSFLYTLCFKIFSGNSDSLLFRLECLRHKTDDVIKLLFVKSFFSFS